MIEADAPAPPPPAPAPRRRRRAPGPLVLGLPFVVAAIWAVAWELRKEPDRAGARELAPLVRTLEQERRELRSEREQLRSVERRLGLERAEIEAQQREVEALLVRVEGNTRFLAADRGRLLAQVARVYETMKPEEAAVILTGLDSGTSTEILRRMPERAAARVMAAFDPAAAARFSESMLRP